MAANLLYWTVLGIKCRWDHLNTMTRVTDGVRLVCVRTAGRVSGTGAVAALKRPLARWPYLGRVLAIVVCTALAPCRLWAESRAEMRWLWVTQVAAVPAAPPVDSVRAGWFSSLDYNTRVVLLGSVVLGMSGGVVGTFLLLRKQALLGDVVSHAALPGVGLAFLTMEILQPGSGKWLPGLLLGAATAAAFSMGLTTWLRHATRLKDDAVLAIVLSVFFGLGIVLLTMVQRLPTGNAAGLAHFIYGKAAAMRAADVRWMAAIALVSVVLCAALFKELRLLAFDERFAASQGWPVVVLDLLIKSLAVIVAVVGLQSVGLLLVVAVLIVPPAAARFWSERLAMLLVLAALFGGVAAGAGVMLSAVYPRMATGATITLCGTVLFIVSLLCGVRRGLLWRWFVLRGVKRKQEDQHLLRAFYEQLCGERGGVTEEELCQEVVTAAQLVAHRSWSARDVVRLLRRAQRNGYVTQTKAGYQLTLRGAALARQVVRNHRLWELYLIRYADSAPALVDRQVDEIEHVLDAELLSQLEEQLAAEDRELPRSPHRVVRGDGSQT
jgi:manganese/zinc/iron transport system permease protein